MIAPTLCFKIMVLAVCKDRNVVLETKPQKGKSVMITRSSTVKPDQNCQQVVRGSLKYVNGMVSKKVRSALNVRRRSHLIVVL